MNDKIKADSGLIPVLHLALVDYMILKKKKYSIYILYAFINSDVIHKTKTKKIIKIHTMFTSYILKGNRKSTH